MGTIGVFDRFFSCAEHEFRLKSCPSCQVLENIGAEIPQKSVFGHFWITVGTKPEVIEPSKMSHIEACHFPFRLQETKIQFFSYKFDSGLNPKTFRILRAGIYANCTLKNQPLCRLMYPYFFVITIFKEFPVKKWDRSSLRVTAKQPSDE